MKAIVTLALLAIGPIAIAQNWGNWINVGDGIQVAFKYGSRPCQGMNNTYGRLRNISSRTYGQVRVAFNKNCGDGEAAISAYDFRPGEVKESPGDFYTTSLHPTNIRLTKLTDSQNKNLVGGGSNGASQHTNFGSSISQDGDNVVNPVNRPTQQTGTSQIVFNNQKSQTVQSQQYSYQQQQAENQRRQDQATRQQQELALQQQAAQEQYNQQRDALEQQRIQTEKTIDAVGDLAQQLMSAEVNELQKSESLFLIEGSINSLTSPWIISSLTQSLGKSPLAYKLDLTILERKGLSFNLSFGGLKQENDNFLLDSRAPNGTNYNFSGVLAANLFTGQFSVGKDLRSSNNRFHFYLGPNLNFSTVMAHSFTYANGTKEYEEETIKDTYWGYGFQFRLRYFLGQKVSLSTGWEYNTFFTTPVISAPYRTHGYGSYNAGLGIRF